MLPPSHFIDDSNDDLFDQYELPHLIHSSDRVSLRCTLLYYRRDFDLCRHIHDLCTVSTTVGSLDLYCFYTVTYCSDLQT